MINKTRNRIQRHCTSTRTIKIKIAKKLMFQIRRNGKSSIDSILILINEIIINYKSRQLTIKIIGIMPSIKTTINIRSKSTGNLRRVIPIFSPTLLITKYFIITKRISRNRTRTSRSIDLFFKTACSPRFANAGQ